MDSKTPNPFSLIVEILVVLVLFVLSLSVLNYFNILPVTKTLPFLSFLPSKTAISQGQAASGVPVADDKAKAQVVIQNVVTPDKPVEVKNDKKEYDFKALENSSIKVEWPITIDFEMAFDVLNAEGKDSSGLAWGNEFPYTDNKQRVLSILRYPPENTWMMAYHADGKDTYFPLQKDDQKKAFAKIRMTISADGKEVTLSGQGINNKFTLPSSLYENSSLMTMSAQTAPNTKLDIYSAYYEH